MTVIRVWLREPHQTNDEAIKLIVDETADISDVLLKVPELLRVQHLKPSEIQAEYKETVLSNRAAISEIFEGSNEGTLVIRPRPGVVIPEAPPKEPHTSEPRGSSAPGCFPRRSLGSHPPPSPRNRAAENSLKMTAEVAPRRRASNGKPPVVKGGGSSSGRGPLSARGPSSARGSSLVRGPSLSRGPSSARELTTTPGSGGPTSKNYHRMGNGRVSKEQPTAAATSRSATPNRDCSVISRHKDPKAVPSRFRQEAAKAKAPAKRGQASSVCDVFKQQWGKPMCAACGHSKQSHWEEQRRRSFLEESRTDNTFDGGIIGVGSLEPATSPDAHPVVLSDELNGTPLPASGEE